MGWEWEMETGNRNVSDTILRRDCHKSYSNKSVQLHMVSITARQYDIGNPHLKLC